MQRKAEKNTCCIHLQLKATKSRVILNTSFGPVNKVTGKLSGVINQHRNVQAAFKLSSLES